MGPGAGRPAAPQTGSLVALAIPNSLQLVLATLGCWKIGAVPVPMHWDLPEWERDRVLEVIDPAVVVDEQTPVGAGALARPVSPTSPLPDAVSPTPTGSAAAVRPASPR